MMPGPGSVACPKPAKRTTVRRRKLRERAANVVEVRAYVFARERNVCRCCRCRPAESMHELRPKSLRGRVSKRNSVAVCGDGVRGCHGYLQRREIKRADAVTDVAPNAEGVLEFWPMTPAAAEWMRIRIGETLVSPPMQAIETEW